MRVLYTWSLLHAHPAVSEHHAWYACCAERGAEHSASGAGKGGRAEHNRGGRLSGQRSARSRRQAAMHLARPHLDTRLLSRGRCSLLPAEPPHAMPRMGPA